jgi:hydrogenase expression/formation protein HypE
MSRSGNERTSGGLEAGAAASIDPEAFGTCPLPQSQYDHIVLGHGGGGRLTADLIERLFVPAFGGDVLARLEDQATVPLNKGDGVRGPRLAFTTDSFVVKPVFFPGGDIGRLAVYGTVNDLAVGGAEPLYLSAAFILEEGFPIANLARIVRSMRAACDEAGVSLVTGDTKVVDKGKGDQVFITTAGIGLVPEGRDLSIRSARPGDCVLVSGTIGDHGVAIMSVREGIAFDTELESDCAPLIGLTRVMLEACPAIRAMRDPTRGGVASVLNELASASGVGVRIDEASIPVRPEVRAACEMLGLDPLYVANEGKLIGVVPAEHSRKLVEAMRAHPLGRDAALIGEVVADHPGMVTLRLPIGERFLMMPAGEQLPRIC